MCSCIIISRNSHRICMSRIHANHAAKHRMVVFVRRGFSRQQFDGNRDFTY